MMRLLGIREQVWDGSLPERPSGSPSMSIYDPVLGGVKGRARPGDGHPPLVIPAVVFAVRRVDLGRAVSTDWVDVVVQGGMAPIRNCGGELALVPISNRGSMVLASQTGGNIRHLTSSIVGATGGVWMVPKRRGISCRRGAPPW